MKNRDLTQGGIIGNLLRLALPLAGGSFLNMAYNLTDIFWLGRVGNDAIASAGTAGLFIWLSVGFMLVGRVGAEIGVSQARGRGDLAEAYRYSKTALYISAALGLLYGAFLFFFRNALVGFFNFEEAHVAADTAIYMGITAAGMPALFIAASISGTFNASGNSRTPFIISGCGIALNMILSPIFILLLDMGVTGAAFTSVVSKYVVLAAVLVAVKRSKNRPFDIYRLTARPRFSVIYEDFRTGKAREIIKLTLPIWLENTLFPLLSIATARFEVAFGAFAVSISRVGGQIESLSWLVGAGFGAALTAFVGQNFGAGKPERISRGVRYSAVFMTGWGLMVTAILWFGSPVVLAMFLPEFVQDPEMTALVVSNLRILAICQVFMNLEFVATNAFRGRGRTVPPSVTGITTNVIRVPLAFILSRSALGLPGVWIAISFTASLRGLSIFLWYMIDMKKERGRLRT